MPKGDKYMELRRYLIKQKEQIVILSFNDIEKILGFILPDSAVNYAEAWWANDYTHSQAIAWMDAGYETDYVTDTYKEKKITFVRR